MPLYRLIEATGREHIGQSAFAFTPPNGELPATTPSSGIQGPTTCRRCATTPSATSTTRSATSRALRHGAGAAGWTRGYDIRRDQPDRGGPEEQPAERHQRSGNGINRDETYTYDAHGNMTSMPHLANHAYGTKGPAAEAAWVGGGTA